MWGMAAAMGAGSLIGALAGGQRSSTNQNYQTVIAPDSQYETQGGQVAGSALSSFQDLVNQGPGASAMTNANQSSQQYAGMLQSYAQGGFMPTQQDYSNANSMTQNIFAPQQVAMQQAFQDQNIQGNRQAALMGRGPNDQTMMNNLMKEQTRQQQTLQGQMTSYSAQQAMNMPQQRLSYMQQLAGVNQGLATQALQNRQALMSMGSGLRQQEQNFQMGTASKDSQTSGGGGTAGTISGLLGGMGTGAGAFNSLSAMFGGGAAAGAAAQPLGGGAAMAMQPKP